MDAVVVWLWDGGHEATKRNYTPEHVNTLARSVLRHVSKPTHFICISDTSQGLSSQVEWLKTPEAALRWRNLASPEGVRFPSCYRRLWNFSADAAKLLGPRILALDIDIVVMRSIDCLFNRKEDFVGWRPKTRWGRADRIGGGTYLLKTGTRAKVWEEFRGKLSIEKAALHGFRGSDQAWLSFMMHAEPVYAQNEGVYTMNDLTVYAKWPNQDWPKISYLDPPPEACVIHFNGYEKPWQSDKEWVIENWR